MRRYSLSVHKDSHCVELAKRHLQIEFQKSLSSIAIRGINTCNPSTLKFETPLYLSVEGQSGIALQISSALNSHLSALPEKYLLILMDYKEYFKIEEIFLLPDDHNALISFTGIVMPYEYSAHNYNLLTKPNYQQVQIGGSIPITPINSNEDKPNKEENSPERSFTLVAGHVIIGDIVDYLKCFDNNPSNDHSYQVTLCVSQPIPGYRDPWGLSNRNHEETGNPICVGHVFLVLTEKTPHKVITRNLGFYPSSFVWPYSPTNQGELVNDSYHDYNIAVQITVKSHEFAAILKFVKQGNDKGFMYDLNSNNCTTFALNALGLANIKISRTIGYWKGGSGCNPGDLGEDLRTYSLLSNMQRITVYQAHGNKGNCIL